MDLKNEVYMCGNTEAGTGSIFGTPGSHQPVSSGSADGFLVKFSECAGLNPLMGSPTAFCENAAIIFSVVVSGTVQPSSYAWAGPNGFNSNLQSPIITGASSVNIGVYTVTLTVAQCVVTASIDVPALNPAPDITAQAGPTICRGSTVALTAGGGVTYYWSNTETSPVIVVSPSTTTNYTVTGFDAIGCGSTAIVTQSVNACTGIEEAELAGIRVYPNPVHFEFVIESASSVEYVLFNILGEQLECGKLAQGKNTLQINYATGNYFLKIRSGRDVQVVKIIKE